MHKFFDGAQGMQACLFVVAAPSLVVIRAGGARSAERWSRASAALDLLCFPPSGLWKSSMYEEELLSERSDVLGAWEGDVLRGLVVTNRVLDESYLLMLMVHPAFRGRSLGEALLRAALHSEWEVQQSLLTLEVRQGNSAAVALYAKCGLREVGRRKRYYHDPEEDALLLTAFLDGDTPPPPPPLGSATLLTPPLDDTARETDMGTVLGLLTLRTPAES